MPRAALFVAALWLGMLVASWVAATVSFRTVDRVLGPGGRPELADRLKAVSPEDRRTVLRHLASEINRWIFRNWALAQLVLALALATASWPSGGAVRALSMGAAAIVAVQVLALGPPIVDLGRSLDFVPRPLPPEMGRRFGLLHAGFVLLDLAKAVVLATFAALAARS